MIKLTSEEIKEAIKEFPTIIAMLTEDKVTELFCMADELLQVFLTL